MRKKALTTLAVLPLLFALPAGAQVEGVWLTDVASGYRAWGRVDDELRWAPWLCRLPMPSAARVSDAGEGAHARKVYFVYASDRPAYMALVADQRRRPPLGFTVVKEAFHPRTLGADEVTDEAPWHGVPLPGGPTTTEGPLGSVPEVYRPTRGEDGALVGPGAPGGLYVMRYVGRRRGTDRGWVYGTLDPSGRVTSEGALERCMSCHRSAPHGRIFGG